ncbi:MAG: hypothetical protein K0Q79_126 [Flavipsychrobacter sp.]|nr:hypothetical protein [Flavipsychrobacter sp.]
MLRCKVYILSLVVLFSCSQVLAGKPEGKKISFDFYGDAIEFTNNSFGSVNFTEALSRETIRAFYEQLTKTDHQSAIDALVAYKKDHNPDDWVFYQLVRTTAESVSPKNENYFRYTLYKWFILNKSGYDATLNIVGDKLLFYVQSDDDIYDIPYFTINGKKYICLNYHDYGFNVDFEKCSRINVAINIPGAHNGFSYKLTQVPDFKPDNYYEKSLEFSYNDVNYHFKIKLNDEVNKMFKNYPVADYHLYFNAPLSRETYNSLIPQLKKNVKGLNVKQGVNYLMHFTRYAFNYAPDKDNFGAEKHLSPEQTLLYDRSDCEDRAALFYCLVKKIYNLPMIVLAFPNHLTIAVKFDKPVGNQVMYNGVAYSVCEPTPQAYDLPVGQLSPDLKSTPYQVAYAYDPTQ